MAQKRTRDIESSPGNDYQDSRGQAAPQALGTDFDFEGKDPVNPSNTLQQEGLKGTQVDPRRQHFGETETRSEKPSLLSSLKGLMSLVRDNPSKYENLDIEKLQLDIVLLQSANEKLLKEKEAAESWIKQLSSEIKNTEALLVSEMGRARKEIAHRDAKLEAVTVANGVLETSNKAAQAEIARLDSQINAVNDKNAKLRQILVPTLEKHVIDTDVVRKFTSLRSSILALVRQTWTMDFKQGVDPNAMSVPQKFVFESKCPLTYDRLRFVVFHHLFLIVFEPRNYFLGHGFEKLEDSIQEAEQQLMKACTQGKSEPVIAWRAAGFEATESFRDNGRCVSLNSKDQIWDYLQPLQTRNSNAEEKGKERLEAVCDAAVELSLMIRQLKDYVWVSRLNKAVGEPLQDWDEYAEEISSVAADNGQKSGSIAYVITGALFKRPKEDMERKLVLEKAEVAVYA